MDECITYPSPKNFALIVLGMHRSGTSALAGVLNFLGVNLGHSLEPAASDNAKGYFENTEVVSAHERLLGALGSSWCDVRPLPDGWAEGGVARAYKAELKEIIARNFGGSALWAVKDPRMCRLLPLWLPILSEMDCAPRFIIMNRHPREVAGSLAKRDGFAAAKSYLLWLSHTLESVKWTEGRQRVCVTYAQLLRDWKSVVGRIASGLGVDWPLVPAVVSGDIGSFLSPELRHQRATAQGAGEELPAMVLSAYAAVEEMAGEGRPGPTEPGLIQLYDELVEGYRMFDALSSAEEDLRAEIARKGKEIDLLREELSRCRGENQILSEELSRFREETPKLREAFAIAERLAYERRDKLAELRRRVADLQRQRGRQDQ